MLTTLGLLTNLPACAPEPKAASPTEKNLKALTVFFGRYLSKHKGQGPADEAEFRKFISAMSPADFTTFGVDPAKLDQLFVSPRDNEPYGIVWKARLGAPGPDGAQMVVWEQKGVNGKRFVSDAVGKIEEVDDETFNKRFAAIKQPK
ncbi:hypothetical protein [Zavarzinella formosa]|uniref:hypothetical protein n=1 Tax=Zavarzinella formosa TaxID=360055 RepID=UPI0012F7C80B|nr:hypothetical protein [Zavarzinella formosa]